LFLEVSPEPLAGASEWLTGAAADGAFEISSNQSIGWISVANIAKRSTEGMRLQELLVSIVGSWSDRTAILRKLDECDNLQFN
jgi:glutathionyl-hydroquinone reductase